MQKDHGVKDETTQITRVKQDDFLAQLTRALEAYDHDGDGLLSNDQWNCFAEDLKQANVA